jgi:hypothetical protein
MPMRDTGPRTTFRGSKSGRIFRLWISFEADSKEFSIAPLTPGKFVGEKYRRDHETV